jgi:hypothetical protein
MTLIKCTPNHLTLFVEKYSEAEQAFRCHVPGNRNVFLFIDFSMAEDSFCEDNASELIGKTVEISGLTPYSVIADYVEIKSSD